MGSFENLFTISSIICLALLSVASRNSSQGQLNGGASGSGNGNGGSREKGESGTEPSPFSTGRKRNRSRSGAENEGSSSMSKRTKVRRLQDDDVIFSGESVDGFDSAVPELNKGKRVLDNNVDDWNSIEVIEIEEEVSDNSNGKEMECMKTDNNIEVIDLDSGEDDEMEADSDDKNWGFDESNPIVLTESSEDSDSEANVDSENECVVVNYTVQPIVSRPIGINLLAAHPDSTDSDVLFTFSESEDDNCSDEDFKVDESDEENDVVEDSVGKRVGCKRKKKSSQVHSDKFDYFHDNDYLGETMPTLETESSGICQYNGENTAALSGEQQVQNVFKDSGTSAVMSNLPQEEEDNKAEEDSENNNQCVGQSNEKVQYVVKHSGVTCDKLQMNVGYSTKNSQKEAKRAKVKQKAKAATADDVSVGMSKNQKGTGPSTKPFKKVEDRNKGKEGQENTNMKGGKMNKKAKKLVVKEKPGSSNDSNLVELLAGCVLSKHNASTSNPLQSEIEVNVDAEPPSSEEAIPLKFTFGNEEPKPVEKSEFEKDLDSLWEEYGIVSKLDEVGKEEKGLEGGSERTLATHCSHEYALDDEIGMCCRICHHIAIEIRYISPLVEKYYRLARSGQRQSFGEAVIPFSDEIQFKAGVNISEAIFNNTEGTVWGIIPGVKEDLHPHQQEGFEFIWTNLTGTTELHKLKNADPNSPGGCIINHAPGTGKTRLTIEFLKSYLELFPFCHPVIIAPASVLLTWEDEFKKWDNVIPFHNMSIPELSGKELVGDSNGMKGFSCRSLKRNDIRLLKLLSWYQQKSILGISYTLYEKIAGESSNVNRAKQSEVMRKVLRETPSLLVLDEGHTPRNKGTQIFKVLSEIKTGKRILLSGTPFQNNFLELYNILCLVKPSFADRIHEDLKKFCQSKRLIQENTEVKHMRWKEVTSGNFNQYSNDQAIDELKMLMAPFVHVHENSILHKSLPGLVECVVILNPCNNQKEILEVIKSSQSAFAFESRLALPSIHPSLFLYCALSEEEKSLVDRDLLEQLKPDPHEGAKTRFLVDFIRFCEAVNEKVIVFSQFIDPLNLIKDHLHSLLEWSEGKEVLQMDGTLEQKKRQCLIHNFNDPNSKAKILLASTRACSEGINLTGASRVILLDVEWNPSVERQAISRAYRLGQKKLVYTYQLITKDTEEWSKYLRMAEKDRISKRVFSASKNESGKQKNSVVAQEDKVLDNMVQHEKLKDIFDSIIYQPKEKILGQSS